MKKTWQTKIKYGMELIMAGCTENEEWRQCSQCPFNDLCTSIYKDDAHNFSTPDSWREEGIWKKS